MQLRENLSFKFMVGIVGGMILVMALGFVWELEQQKKQALQELKEKSAIIAQQLLATRTYIAKSQERINQDSLGHFEFKQMNPAAVVREISLIFNRTTKYHIKQTRLNPRAPANAPDVFERAQLQQFTKTSSLREVWGEDLLNGKQVFRYMIPLYITDKCLLCHGGPAGHIDVSGYPKEGYQLGDLAGALSITVPMDTFAANVRSAILNRLTLISALVGLSILSIYLLMRSLVAKPLDQMTGMAIKIGQGDLTVSPLSIQAHGEMKVLAREFAAMATRIQEFYNILEQKVADRTVQLSNTNAELQLHRHQLQEANRQLIQASRYKSEFLANMSHELRTPLTSVLAFAELLLDGVAGELTVEQEEYLRDIYESGHQLLVLISDILDLSKIEAGKMELRPQWFEPGEIVFSLGSMLKPLVEKKDLNWRVILTQGLPQVWGDHNKVKQILLNLLSNAIKFTPAGGRIEVKIWTTPESEARIYFSVTDTGIGIKKEDHQIIFEQFRQVDGSISREYSGTGLGLALVKYLVEMHGGGIGVDSEPGLGSTFAFWLPVRPREQVEDRNYKGGAA